MIKIIMGLLTLATLSSAIDLRLTTGAMMPNDILLDNATPVGVEAAVYSSYRENGLNYGIRSGISMAKQTFEDGSFGYFNMDIMYRKKRTYEPYITGGITYQRLGEEGYGFGYNYGAGMRYVSCGGYMIGVEFSLQDMQFSSSKLSSLAVDGQKYQNHNITLSIGYRFK